MRLCNTAVGIVLQGRVCERTVIGSSSALLDYLHFKLSTVTTERFRTLFLNARNELLADEQIVAGTVDSAPFYSREIIGRAIELGATSLILVHNHPSGDPNPSAEDVECTRRLAMLCAGLDITLLDHLIVGRLGTVSLRAAGNIS